MKPETCRSLATALVLPLLVAPALLAQSTSTASSATGEEVVQMETFVINTDSDRGYTAVEALAGGRTNTPIKLTPASLSSLTKTFIEDLGIQNVREALQWTPNVVPTDPLAGKGFGGQAFHAWSFNYRGAGAGQQGGPGPTRNYFSFYQDADAYNVERIEFTRGPNSILFGLGTVGGTLTTYTKVPRFNDTFFSPAVIVDNNGSFRFEADYNIAFNEKFALRLNLLSDDNEGWREADENERRAVDLAFNYKISDRTSIRAEIEGARVERTLISTTIGDKISGWDSTTSSVTWGADPTGGTARTIPIANAGAWGDWLNPFWVYIPSLGDKALMGWAGGRASSSSLMDVGAALPFAPYAGWYPDRIKLPWEAEFSSTAGIPVRESDDWTYGRGISKIDYENATLFLDHKINDGLDLQFGLYRYSDDQEAKDYEGTGGAAIDINRQLPDGTPNPNYGKAFADFFLSKQTQSRSVTEARAQLNYSFERDLFNRTWSQLFSVSTSRKKLTISARQYLAQVERPLANPADWAQNMVWGRLYLDEPNQLMDIPESLGGQTISYRPAYAYWFDFDDEFELTDVAVVSHSRLLDDTLSILLGARRDSYDEHLVELRRGPDRTNNIIDESDSGTTLSGGVVYWMNWLGVFANYSENIAPPNAGSQPYIDGRRPAPEEGKGLEFGLRATTGDGKYYATLSRYDTESRGRNVENPVGLRNVWQRYNVAVGNPQDSGFGSLAYSDTTSLDVSGYEFELTANPTPNLRLQASYGLPDAEVVDFYPHSRAHIDENLATWNAAVNATSDETARVNLQNAIASAQNTIAQAREGAPQQGSVDYTASFFAHYTMLEGQPLKGLSFGGGATITGKRYLGVYSGEDYFGSSITNVTAMIAYDTRIRDVRVRVALNIDNLLDANDPIVTSYHWGFADANGRHVREGYYFQNPRTFRLSTRLTF
jgi:outer membrane receptor protein involved in Fe transport